MKISITQVREELYFCGEFAEDVCAGLSRTGQKELHSKYLYDDLGTALFEAITLLPEYGLTRAGLRLLDRHAEELVRRCGRLSVIAELGSGSGEKARRILRHVDVKRLTYCPIDISSAALASSKRTVSDFSDLRVTPIRASYLAGLRAASRFRTRGSKMLVLFLGSSIGNFTPDAAEDFLREVRNNMLPGDVFVLSTDLVKAEDRMLAAYDDAIGVTAAFNLNLLARINRELNANFDLKMFRHLARYDSKEHRIEMHLQSLGDQIVTISPGYSVRLKNDETIWTESSYKFLSDQVVLMAERAGFHCDAQWIDEEWPFAENVLRAR